jgi:hypothetical protein
MRNNVLINDIVLFEKLLSKHYDSSDFETRLWLSIKKHINLEKRSDDIPNDIQNEEEICLALADTYNKVL